MKTFIPVTGSEAEWNAAFYRLEDYLRALHVENKIHQSQIVLRLMERAAARHAKDPELNPTTLAMEEARAAMEDWFKEILPQRERIAVVGLLSLAAAEVTQKWPLAFLGGPVPAELLREMQESDLRAGPDLQVSSMVPRPIDVGPLLNPVHLTEFLGKWSLAILVTLIISAASASYLLFLR